METKKTRIRGEPDEQLTCPGCSNTFFRAAAYMRKKRKRGDANFYCSTRCKVAHQTTPDAERFWRLVLTSDGCWEWLGGLDRDGYGFFTHSEQGLIRAHRFSWELANGRHPGNLLVCHSCDNPTCVRPDHLWAGTGKDNQSDMSTKGRHGNRPCKPGVGNIKAKLRAEDVLELRRRATAGELTADLAKYFKLSTGNVRAIVRRITWKHI